MDEDQFVLTQDHDHYPDPLEEEVDLFRRELLHGCIFSTRPFVELYDEAKVV